MEITKQRKTGPIKSPLEIAEENLVDAERQLKDHEREYRAANHRWELAKQGAFLIPEEDRHELRSAEEAVVKSFNACESSKLMVALAKNALRDVDKVPPVIPAFTVPDEKEMGKFLQQSLAEWRPARKSRIKLEDELVKLKTELVEISKERDCILSEDKIPLEERAARLSVLTSKSEILSGEIPKAQSSFDHAIRQEAELARGVIGLLNTKCSQSAEAVDQPVAAFRASVSQLPIFNLIHALENLRPYSDPNQPNKFVAESWEYAGKHEAYLAEIESQGSEIGALASLIAQKVEDWQTRVDKIMTEEKGENA